KLLKLISLRPAWWTVEPLEPQCGSNSGLVRSAAVYNSAGLPHTARTRATSEWSVNDALGHATRRVVVVRAPGAGAAASAPSERASRSRARSRGSGVIGLRPP